MAGRSVLTRCFICNRPALMGYHPLCVLDSAKLKPAGEKESMARSCAGCPYNKGPTWMDQGRVLLNRLRVKYGVAQVCHMSVENVRPHAKLCKGAQVCIMNDGSETVRSRQEMQEVKPVPISEVRDHYEAIVFGKVIETRRERKPERIPVILEKLGELWAKHPDLRLGQLMTNLQSPTSGLFNMEDDIMLQAIASWPKKQQQGRGR